MDSWMVKIWDSKCYNRDCVVWGKNSSFFNFLVSKIVRNSMSRNARPLILREKVLRGYDWVWVCSEYKSI